MDSFVYTVGKLYDKIERLIRWGNVSIDTFFPKVLTFFLTIYNHFLKCIPISNHIT